MKLCFINTHMTHCNLINCKYYHILIIAAMYNTLNNRLHIPLIHITIY